MKKLIIACAILAFSSSWTTPIFAMKDGGEKELRVTNGLTCEGCERQFVRAEHRVEHIISVHYACPWCSDLVYLNSRDWRGLSENDRQARVDHIKKCAQIKKTSLWQCQKCSALFHYAKKDHKCGVKHQVNLVADKGLDIEVVLKIEQENTCNKCSRSFVHARACKNHMIREHAVCPWCSAQLAEKSMSYKKLDLLDRAAVSAHMIECAQKNEESLFACDTCCGVMLCGRAVHVGILCKGMVYQASERVRKNGDTPEQQDLPVPIQEPSSAELLSLIQELGSIAQGSSSSDQFSNEQEILSSGTVVLDPRQGLASDSVMHHTQELDLGRDLLDDYTLASDFIMSDDHNNVQEDGSEVQDFFRDLFAHHDSFH
jgi:hypothetical protein